MGGDETMTGFHAQYKTVYTVYGTDAAVYDLTVPLVLPLHRRVFPWKLKEGKEYSAQLSKTSTRTPLYYCLSVCCAALYVLHCITEGIQYVQYMYARLSESKVRFMASKLSCRYIFLLTHTENTVVKRIRPKESMIIYRDILSPSHSSLQTRCLLLSQVNWWRNKPISMHGQPD